MCVSHLTDLSSFGNLDQPASFDLVNVPVYWNMPRYQRMVANSFDINSDALRLVGYRQPIDVVTVMRASAFAAVFPGISIVTRGG